MDLNEGVEPVPEKEELVQPEPIFGFSLVHDRVFVTWFEHNAQDDYSFVAEPRAIELTPEEAEQFNDLLNQQTDQMQALLQGFAENRREAFELSGGAGLQDEELSIPTGVYFAEDNFYSIEPPHKGMGTAFWRAWKNRRHEFPTRQQAGIS